jgi:uncharacterized protein YdcH (DUF465 family)
MIYKTLVIKQRVKLKDDLQNTSYKTRVKLKDDLQNTSYKTMSEIKG